MEGEYPNHDENTDHIGSYLTPLTLNNEQNNPQTNPTVYYQKEPDILDTLLNAPSKDFIQKNLDKYYAQGKSLITQKNFEKVFY